jgi:hypothetical protein
MVPLFLSFVNDRDEMCLLSCLVSHQILRQVELSLVL